MIALCLAAILGALISPLLAAIFASPALLLTAPFFASLAAFAAGCGLALGAQRKMLRQMPSQPAIAGMASAAPENHAGSNPQLPASDALADALVGSLRKVLSQAEERKGHRGDAQAPLAERNLRKSG